MIDSVIPAFSLIEGRLEELGIANFFYFFKAPFSSSP